MADNGHNMPSGPVLIVEDELLVATFLADIVEDLELAVIGPAASREAALEAAAASPPAVAIVDANLGAGGSGIVLAKELKDAYGTAIIILSGYADLAASEAVVALDPVAVLQKPCLPDDLAAALRAAASSGT
jgi:two-component system, response regulator PdtaR